MFNSKQVNVYGGQFRTIYGNYTHHEYHNSTTNHNSNNVMGNTLTESHVDNSQRNYGSKAAFRWAQRNDPSEASARANRLPTGTTLAAPPVDPFREFTTQPGPTPTVTHSAYPTQSATTHGSNTTFVLPPDTSHTQHSFSYNTGDLMDLPPAVAAHIFAALNTIEKKVSSNESMNPCSLSAKSEHSSGFPAQFPSHVDRCADEPEEANEYPEGQETIVCDDERAISPPTEMLEQLSLNGDRKHASVTAPFQPATIITPPHLITPPHQFLSQKHDPTSIHSNIAHAFRSNITAAITTANGVQGSAPLPNSNAYASPPTGNPYGYTSAQHHYGSCITPTQVDPVAEHISSLSSAPPSHGLPHMVFNEPYAEITHNNYTINLQGSGMIANNTVQTLYQGPIGTFRSAGLDTRKGDEERGSSRRRQSNYTGRRR